MTYIITSKCKESIIMASDSRLNYHGDVNINGILYQEIKAIADCSQKTLAHMGFKVKEIAERLIT